MYCPSGLNLESGSRILKNSFTGMAGGGCSAIDVPFCSPPPQLLNPRMPMVIARLKALVDLCFIIFYEGAKMPFLGEPEAHDP